MDRAEVFETVHAEQKQVVGERGTTEPCMHLLDQFLKAHVSGGKVSFFLHARAQVCGEKARDVAVGLWRKKFELRWRESRILGSKFLDGHKRGQTECRGY